MWATSRDGVRIAFEAVGRGHPLVLLHGFFGDRTTWWSAGHVAALAGHFRLILVDARGHGGSEAPHDVDSYRIDRQVDDIIAVLDVLGIDLRAAVRRIGNATLTELPDCGHLDAFLRLDLTLPIVQPFLARCSTHSE